MSHEHSQSISSLAQAIASLGGCRIGVIANGCGAPCGELFLWVSGRVRLSKQAIDHPLFTIIKVEIGGDIWSLKLIASVGICRISFSGDACVACDGVFVTKRRCAMRIGLSHQWQFAILVLLLMITVLYIVDISRAL